MPHSVETPRVLIVEDEPLTGLTLAEMLVDQGHQIIGPIASRKEALAALDRTRPDCVILDFSLVDGTSAGLGRELRARGTPFIVFSGYGREEVAADAFGSEPWVKKPAPVQMVAAALREALSAREQGA